MGAKYPNGTRHDSRSSSKSDPTSQMINELLQEFIEATSAGVWFWCRSFFNRKSVYTVPITAGLAYWTYAIVSTGGHLRWIYEIEPTFFTPKLLNSSWQWSFWYHFAAVYLCLFTPILLVLGAWIRSIRTKFRRIFLKTRLKNGLGDTPKFIAERKLDPHSRQFIFDGNGLGISDFEAKKEQIESHFRSSIESIKLGAHNGQIAVVFTKKKFPSKLNYIELLTQKTLPKESFYLGVSTEGNNPKGSRPPSYAIAGTTGIGTRTTRLLMLLR
jgi:hypothetical protein